MRTYARIIIIIGRQTGLSAAHTTIPFRLVSSYNCAESVWLCSWLPPASLSFFKSPKSYCSMLLPARTFAIHWNMVDLPVPVSPTSKMVYGELALFSAVKMCPFLRLSDVLGQWS
jgi:hypothetical protein